jgi:hypothetical protein
MADNSSDCRQLPLRQLQFLCFFLLAAANRTAIAMLGDLIGGHQLRVCAGQCAATRAVQIRRGAGVFRGKLLA